LGAIGGGQDKQAAFRWRWPRS